MKESCCSFGEGGRLAGVLTEPSTRRERGVVVLVNAGLVPKCGPFRLYTELARRFAEDGITTLRFDLGGLGESRSERPDLPLRDRTALDVGAALDFVGERHPSRPIVLGGLCSGAEDSFRSAEQDDRVAGVVMVDPFAYRTLEFFPRHWLYRFGRRVRRAVGRHRPFAGPAGDGGARLVHYAYMPRGESRRILRTLIARRARVHFVYTGGARETFNHSRQLRAMFPGVDFDGLVTVDHLPELDHTQMLSDDRARLTDAVARSLAWVPS